MHFYTGMVHYNNAAYLETYFSFLSNQRESMCICYLHAYWKKIVWQFNRQEKLGTRLDLLVLGLCMKV